MKVGVFRGSETDKRVIETLDAFTKGLQHLGVDHFTAPEYVPCDVAVVWGVTSAKFFDKTAYRDEVRAANPNTIVLERGFIKRDKYYAAGWGDVAGRADFCNEASPADRWKRLKTPLAKNWVSGGEYILVLGQIPWDTSVQHIDYSRWLCDTIDVLRKTESLIVLRNHPLLPVPFGPFEGVYMSGSSLTEDLASASDVITFNSTSAVDASLVGVPVFAADSKCMACGGDQDRKQWAHDIAYTQWKLREMEKGLAFKHLVGGLWL